MANTPKKTPPKKTPPKRAAPKKAAPKRTAAKKPAVKSPAKSAAAGPDFNNMMAEFVENMRAFQPQGVDLSAFMESRKREFESLNEINNQAMEGFQTIAKLQQNIFEETMKQASVAANAFAKADNAGDLAQVQSAFLRDAFDKALANMQRLAEAVNASQQQTLQAASEQFNQSLEELNKLGKQLRP